MRIPLRANEAHEAYYGASALSLHETLFDKVQPDDSFLPF